jgi:hypothetical protein
MLVPASQGQIELEGTCSEMAQALLYLKGKPFSFDGYEFFKDPYDTDAKSVLWMCARQVSKSTTIANKIALLSALIDYFTCLYVAPTENQVTTFNKQKLDAVLKHSPDFKKLWFTKDNTDQAMHKKLSNGSDIILRSCYATADSIRGISSDLVAIDEIQDILTDNIPVIMECMARSDYKHTLLAGTPKTNMHAIQHYWQRSTQNEWLVPCVSCNRWNRLDENNVKYKGLSCAQCDAFLDPSRGEWVRANLDPSATVEGYRVPQLITTWVPWHGENGIWDKYTSYSKEKFYNEVLALSYDNATCPITLEEMMAVCDPNFKMIQARNERARAKALVIAAGIDWGTGQDDCSYTVLNIGGFMPDGRFILLFSKRFSGLESDPEYQIAAIIRYLQAFKIDVVGVDWGLGFGMNSRIAKAVGEDKVHVFFNSDNQKEPMKWDPKGERWTLSRTTVMTDMFKYLKTKQVILPRWDEIKDLCADALNIFVDYNTRSGSIVMRYDHVPNKPDDWFHSLIYCYLAAVIEKTSF